jgi:hypothetical protein
LLSLKAKLSAAIILPLILGSLFGLPFGLLILTLIDPVLLSRLTGILILCFTALLLLVKLKLKPNTANSFLVGSLVGALQTAIGVNGPPLVLYLNALSLKPLVYRRTLALVFLTISLLSLPLFLTQNLLTVPNLTQASIAAPTVLIATALGNRFSPRIPKPLFHTFTYLLITLSALSLLC